MVVPFDFSVLWRRTQVLADGEDFNSRIQCIVHHVENFALFFPESHHDSSLDKHGRVHLLCGFQEAERRVVIGLESDGGVEPPRCFNVVRENIRTGFSDDTHRVERALKVGCEQFDLDVGIAPANLVHEVDKYGSAAVGEIVAINDVMTACLNFRSAIAAATLAGSARSSSVGFPLVTAQKAQARVQISPRIMKVAVR
jgi:hypothetical protein